MISHAGIIVYNLEDENTLKSFRESLSLLRSLGIIPVCEAEACRYDKGVKSFEESENKPDMIITIGGDGTFLRGVRYALRYDAPILGVNRGTLGFLTETVPSQMENAIRAVLEGRYTLEKRALLKVGVKGRPETWSALNDAVITRGGYSRLITVKVYCDGTLTESFKADGIVISTPTGSTGYSFSAGGPVIYPSVPCMLITPVCAHTLQHFSCIVPASSEICVELAGDELQSAQLQTDGQTGCTLNNGSSVRISRSEKTINMIRTKPFEYFNVVRHMLNEPRQD